MVTERAAASLSSESFFVRMPLAYILILKREKKRERKRKSANGTTRKSYFGKT